MPAASCGARSAPSSSCDSPRTCTSPTTRPSIGGSASSSCSGRSTTKTSTAGGSLKAINKGVSNARDWKPAENLPLAVAALRPAARVLITMHRGPDGDALGSALALACTLRDLGREVTVYNPDELPYNFRFLSGAAKVAKSLPAEAAFDVTVATDAGSFERLGPDVPKDGRRGVLLNLDHHLTTEPFGDVN